MRPDTQLSDEMTGVSETACVVEASRRPISGRTLPEPAEATAVFTLIPRTRRSRKVWAFLLLVNFADAASRLRGGGAGWPLSQPTPRRSTSTATTAALPFSLGLDG